MNNMSSLSVSLSVDQVYGGREGGEREVEVSLFEVPGIVLYCIGIPVPVPVFSVHPTFTNNNNFQQQPFSTTLPDLSACFQDHA